MAPTCTNCTHRIAYLKESRAWARPSAGQCRRHRAATSLRDYSIITSIGWMQFSAPWNFPCLKSTQVMEKVLQFLNSGVGLLILGFVVTTAGGAIISHIIQTKMSQN